MTRFHNNLLLLASVTTAVMVVAQNCGSNTVEKIASTTPRSGDANLDTKPPQSSEGLALAQDPISVCVNNPYSGEGSCRSKTAEEVVAQVLDVIDGLFPSGSPFQPVVVGSFANGTASVKRWPKELSFDQVQNVDKMPRGLERIQGAHDFNDLVGWVERLEAQGGRPSDLEILMPSGVSADELVTIAKFVFAQTGILIEWVP